MPVKRHENRQESRIYGLLNHNEMACANCLSNNHTHANGKLIQGNRHKPAKRNRIMLKQKKAAMSMQMVGGIIIVLVVSAMTIAFQTGAIDPSGNELLGPVLNAAGLGGPKIVDFKANPSPDNTHGTLEYLLQNIGRVKSVKIIQKHKTYPAATEKETTPTFYELEDKETLKQYRGDKDIDYTIKPGYNTFTLVVEPNKQEQTIC